MSDDGILSPAQIVDVGCALVDLRPLPEVLSAILHAAAHTMRAERALIILEHGVDDLSVAASWHEAEADRPDLGSISRTLLEEALRSGRPVLTESAIEDPRFSGNSSIILQHIQSAVIVPLIGAASGAEARSTSTAAATAICSARKIWARCRRWPRLPLAIENARRYDVTRRTGTLQRRRRDAQGQPDRRRGGHAGTVRADRARGRDRICRC